MIGWCCHARRAHVEPAYAFFLGIRPRHSSNAKKIQRHSQSITHGCPDPTHAGAKCLTKRIVLQGPFPGVSTMQMLCRFLIDENHSSKVQIFLKKECKDESSRYMKIVSRD